MKAYRIILLLVVLLSGNSHLSAQLASDVFSYFGDQIMSNVMFFSQETVPSGTNYIPSGIPIYEIGKDMTNRCKIAYIDTDKNSDSQLCEGIRIYGGDNTILLEQWSYSAIQDVSNITLGASTKRYLPIRLDSKTTALIFGGAIYDTSEESPEMMIVVARADEARLVFDRPAMVYAYTPEPNFSIEYVEKMDWGNYENCDVFTPNAKTIATQTKHKIWKEGNMLKYKSWK